MTSTLLSVNVGQPQTRPGGRRFVRSADLEGARRGSRRRARRQRRRRRPGRPPRARRAGQGRLRVRDRGHPLVGGRARPRAGLRRVRREPDDRGHRRQRRPCRGALGDRHGRARGLRAAACRASSSRSEWATRSSRSSSSPPGRPGRIPADRAEGEIGAGDAVESSAARPRRHDAADEHALLVDHACCRSCSPRRGSSTEWRDWIAARRVIAKVEPITTARALRGPFDYLRPDGVEKGSLLVVPFGRRDVTGVVVGLAERSDVPAEKLVAPRRVLEERVPPELVDLAAWMAREYCSTFARALQLVLPPTGRARRRPRCGRRRATRPTPRRRRARLDRAASATLLASLPRFAGPDLRVAAAPGGRAAWCRRAARRSAARPSTSPVGARGERPRAHARQARRADATIVRRRSRGDSGCCCTASPARARPRSTSARSRRCSRRGAGRDRPRARRSR